MCVFLFKLNYMYKGGFTSYAPVSSIVYNCISKN